MCQCSSSGVTSSRNRPGLAAAPADRLQLLDRAGVEQADQFGLLQIGAVMDVLDHDDADEIRMAAVMVEGEFGEQLQRLDRRQVIQFEFLLAGAHLRGRLLRGRGRRGPPCRRNSSRSCASTCWSSPRSRRCARRKARWRRTRPSPRRGCSCERRRDPASSRCAVGRLVVHAVAPRSSVHAVTPTAHHSKLTGSYKAVDEINQSGTKCIAMPGGACSGEPASGRLDWRQGRQRQA